MAERNITSVDLLESVTNKTNAIVEENGTLNKVNLSKEFNTINTKIDNEVNTLSNNIAQLSNPNLLINSDFRNPINQRGQTSYNFWWTKAYTIDRWCTIGCSVTVNDGFVTFANVVGEFTDGIHQYFENVLPSGDYTLTINVKSITGNIDTNGVHLTSGLNIIHLNGAINQVHFEFAPSASVDIEYIKLEQGSIATPLVPKSYAEELALCQRYYRCMHAAWLNLVNCIVTSSTNLKYQLPFEMRVLPTVTFSHPSWTIGDMATANKNVTITSMEVIQYFLDITISSGHGLTKGQVCTLTVGGSESTAGLEFDAEIY